MATKIVVDKKAWDEAFELTLQTLKATRFTFSNKSDAQFENSELGQMHRAFHYEICMLKQRLEER